MNGDNGLCLVACRSRKKSINDKPHPNSSDVARTLELPQVTIKHVNNHLHSIVLAQEMQVKTYEKRVQKHLFPRTLETGVSYLIKAAMNAFKSFFH